MELSKWAVRHRLHPAEIRHLANRRLIQAAGRAKAAVPVGNAQSCIWRPPIFEAAFSLYRQAIRRDVYRRGPDLVSRDAEALHFRI
jgi:hypothetical protein